MKKAIVLLVAAAVSLFSQVPVAEFHAKITGGNGAGGKCTGEVEVDDVVEIQFFGDTARMQTLGGQAATWKRFDCTAPLPGNPSGFRLRGVDGRGRQTLVRDPADGLGVAVIRIEDPQRGRESYTFDIEWGGGSGTTSTSQQTSSNGGFSNTQAAANTGGFGNTTGGFGQTAQTQTTGIADFAYSVHACQNAIINRAAQSGYSNVVLWAANLQDNAGNNDVLSGNATASPAGGGNAIRVQYSCTVNASTGRVVDLQTR